MAGCLMLLNVGFEVSVIRWNLDSCYAEGSDQPEELEGI